MAAAGRGGLRVVAGTLGGRRLQGPGRGSEVRPSTERTREAIFSMIGPVSGTVLDLYCGSGALGIEALSRGADAATFVDIDTELVERNVAALGIEAACTVVRAEATEFLGAGDESFELIFCDPPYRLADRLGPLLEQPLRDRLAPGGLLIVESPAAAPIELGLPVLRERRYGDALVRIHREGQS